MKVLKLRAGSRVLHIERIRSLGGKVAIVKSITLPNSLFPGAEKLELPNNLYELYRSRFGVTIARSTEKLKAVAAKRREEKYLGVEISAPLLWSIAPLIRSTAGQRNGAFLCAVPIRYTIYPI